MLLHKSGCFLQAFEGERAEVRRLYQRIARDPRHGNIIALRNGCIEEREFSDWTMGFKHPSRDEVRKQPGFSEMLKMLLRRGRCTLDISFAIKLLRSFAEEPPEASGLGVEQREDLALVS